MILSFCLKFNFGSRAAIHQAMLSQFGLLAVFILEVLFKGLRLQISDSLFFFPEILSWAWSHQIQLSDLRTLQKKSENFRPSIFVIEVRKIIKFLEMSFKTVPCELNQK
jgi:hypothetical protein